MFKVTAVEENEVDDWKISDLVDLFEFDWIILDLIDWFEFDWKDLDLIQVKNWKDSKWNLIWLKKFVLKSGQKLTMLK